MEKTLIKSNSYENFDPNGQGYKGNLFGLPFTPETASLVVIPVPWDVTVSYHSGAALGPTAILDASYQVDLCIKDIPDAWKLGITMLPITQQLIDESEKLRELVTQHVTNIERHGSVSPDDPIVLKINEASENLNIYVKSTASQWLDKGKMVALVGGDHSIPLGFLRALSERHKAFGILQIDAHADLRKAYQGMTYSHASIMHNALRIQAIQKLVQVGIRDFCEEELLAIKKAGSRVVTFFDDDIRTEMYQGKSWDMICDRIVATLPDKVYISFDIDGLDPKLCPNTGTPVPGGFEFHQIVHLLYKIVRSNRLIIGFDLNEVAPAATTDWDGNVGARMLYQLCNLMGVSQKRLRLLR